jgi:hypothetical protein
MAEGAFAPIPDRLRAPLDQPINSQSSLLTDDYIFTAHRDRLMTLTNVVAVIVLALAQALIPAGCRTLRNCRYPVHVFSDGVLAMQAPIQSFIG